MRIENLRTEKNAQRVRVAATIIWEDCDRPAHDVYFETDEKFSDSLSCDPNAFMVACTIPAMHFGEQRVAIDTEICPELRKGLVTAMSWLRHWFYEPGRSIVRIDASVRSKLSDPRTPERAAFFYSGGIDSFATLRANRLEFPLPHPGSIRDGILVFGLEQDEPERFRYVLDALSGVADAAGITLIPVYTNVYLTYRQEDSAHKWKFWDYEFQSAALSSVAHALSRRLTVAYISASDSLPNDAYVNRKHVVSYGAHPVLDHNYSSAELRIHHDGITLSRLEKTRLVADWDVGLQNLRVCNQYKRYKPGILNCGRCEKCLRTMLALKIVGVLDKTRAFPVHDLHEALRVQRQLNPYYYLEMLPHLKALGFDDLVRIIEKKISIYRRHKTIDSWRRTIRGLSTTISAAALSNSKRRGGDPHDPAERTA